MKNPLLWTRADPQSDSDILNSSLTFASSSFIFSADDMLSGWKYCMQHIINYQNTKLQMIIERRLPLHINQHKMSLLPALSAGTMVQQKLECMKRTYWGISYQDYETKNKQESIDVTIKPRRHSKYKEIT